MKSVFIKTVTGRETPDVVKSMAEITRGMGGEWQKSKIIHLGSQFAAMMLVSIDEDKEAELKATLEKEFPAVQFFYAEADENENVAIETVTVAVDCKDRPGLTHDLAKILSDLDLKAENMEFHRLPVVPVGGTVYTAKMTLSLDDATRSEFVQSVEDVCQDVRINFE